MGITLASGQELKCHKVILAQNSSVFATMLKSELEEGKTNKMKLDRFDDVTVFYFLGYIYARNEHIQVKAYLPGGYPAPGNFYQRNFQKEKLTLELFKMAHLYNVKDLLADCTEYLKTTITVASMANAMEIWREASKRDNAVLCEAVALHVKSNNTSLKMFLEFLKAIECKHA